MSEHVPGPWNLTPYRPEGEDRGYTITAWGADVGEIVIADCTISPLDYSIVAANARLIAAAPEMLALVRALTECIADFYGGKLDRDGSPEEQAAVKAADALLAKIEGKP